MQTRRESKNNPRRITVTSASKRSIALSLSDYPTHLRESTHRKIYSRKRAGGEGQEIQSDLIGIFTIFQSAPKRRGTTVIGSVSTEGGDVKTIRNILYRLFLA